MKAVILAGGAGTALRPLTADRPAPLLPVANRPIVEYLLEHLLRHGVRDATVALHHCPHPLETHLGDGTRWGVALRYSLERRPLGTGGATRRAAARFGETFVLAFGTAVVTADLGKALAAHRIRDAALTLLVNRIPGDSALLGLDEGSAVTRNGSRSPAPFTFTGLALVEPTALRMLPPGEPADLMGEWIPGLLAAGLTVHGHVTPEPGLVVSTLADLAAANRRALAGEFPGLVLPGFEVLPGVRLSRGARIHPSARVVAPLLIGPNSLVGRGATVEASILGEEVIVGPRARVRNGVVLTRTHVGPGIRLEDAVVDRHRVGRPDGGTWTPVADVRILGDTRAPLTPRRGALAGQLVAAGVLAASAPLWGPVLVWLALETRGRPLRARRVVGARGRTACLLRVAVRGPLGRLLRRLGLVRAPHLWSVVRGDLHWVGVRPRRPAASDGDPSGAGVTAPPGLVTLATLAPVPLRGQDRLALDRLYAATRSRGGDVRLLATAVRHRLAVWSGSRKTPPIPPVGRGGEAAAGSGTSSRVAVLHRAAPD